MKKQPDAKFVEEKYGLEKNANNVVSFLLNNDDALYSLAEHKFLDLFLPIVYYYNSNLNSEIKTCCFNLLNFQNALQLTDSNNNPVTPAKCRKAHESNKPCSFEYKFLFWQLFV